LGGKKHGKGTMTLQNGDVYEGSWENDLMHGHGNEGCFPLSFFQISDCLLSNVNSRICFEFLGKYTFADGSYYEGQWSFGKRHGRGVFVSFNGSRYVLLFRNISLCVYLSHCMICIYDGEEFYSFLKFFGLQYFDLADMKVSGLQINGKGLENLSITMETLTKVNGLITNVMEKGTISSSSNTPNNQNFSDSRC
jgi:hypothetical protein